MNWKRIKQGLEIHFELLKRAVDVYSNGTEEEKREFFEQFFGLDNEED